MKLEIIANATFAAYDAKDHGHDLFLYRHVKAVEKAKSAALVGVKTAVLRAAGYYANISRKVVGLCMSNVD